MSELSRRGIGQLRAFQRTERRGEVFVRQVVDELSGYSFHLRARSVVNATGPWAQGLSLSRVCLRLTKGIHLVFDRGRLPSDDAVVVTVGSRLLFVIPWGDRVIVGTTDTDYTRSGRRRPKPGARCGIPAMCGERFIPASCSGFRRRCQ
ncbi:MAG: FAD-dependent oxidoreductase [Verrucomicrobia bacterium]|nr:FAD-dependent oxidoreductase [Verrucomicrobiota bacterium]